MTELDPRLEAIWAAGYAAGKASRETRPLTEAQIDEAVRLFRRLQLLDARPPAVTQEAGAPDPAKQEKAAAARRRLRAQIAVNTSWARTTDRSARVAPAVEARLRKFEEQADPGGVMSPQERRAAALLLRKADMQRLRLRQLNRTA